MDSNLLFKAATAAGTLVAGGYIANQLFGAQSEACDAVERVFECRYIRLSFQEVGLVIGKHGCTIHRLEEETGFHLRVVHKVPSTVQALEVKRLGGTNETDQREQGAVPYLEVMKKVEEKLEFLLELLEITIRRLKENHVEETMLVPRKYLGAIIGRGGSNIRSISSATSTTVTCDEHQHQNGVFGGTGASDKCKVTIVGSESQVAIAAEMVEQTIWSCLNAKCKDLGTKRGVDEIAKPIEEQLAQLRAVQQTCETSAENEVNWA